MMQVSKKEDFLISFTYNTNKIEGSELSLTDVENIILYGKQPRNAKEDDIRECVGLYTTMKTLMSNFSFDVEPDFISIIHYNIFSESKPFAGRFRIKPDESVVIMDSHKNIVGETSPPDLVYEEIEDLCKSYNDNKDDLYEPFRFHIRFEHIHPFLDGNGRVGRVLLNYMLLKQHMDPIDIKYEDRAFYYSLFQMPIVEATKRFYDFYKSKKYHLR